MKVAIIGLDIAKHIFQLHGTDARWEGRPTPKATSAGSYAVFRKPAVLQSGAGGMRRGTLLGAAAERDRALRASDGSTVREAIREVQQKRRQRCGGYLRSGSAPKYAVCTSKR